MFLDLVVNCFNSLQITQNSMLFILKNKTVI